MVDITITVWIFIVPVLFIILSVVTVRVGQWRRRQVVLSFPILLYAMVAVLAPQDIKIPVRGADRSDWHPESFWHEPWGASIVHRGIDIFGKRGTDILSPTPIIIIWNGFNPTSGKFIIGIDFYLRLHFFAHLNEFFASRWTLHNVGELLGTVGNTGNAQGTPPHLHYGVASIIPRPWLITSQTLGHLRAFYLDPDTLIR